MGGLDENHVSVFTVMAGRSKGCNVVMERMKGDGGVYNPCFFFTATKEAQVICNTNICNNQSHM